MQFTRSPRQPAKSSEADGSRLTRRKLLGLIPLPFFAAARPASTKLEEPFAFGPPPVSLVFNIQRPGPYHYDAVKGTMRLIPRWEIPSVCAGPQPEPIGVKVRPDHGDARTTVFRYWKAGDEKHCRLCRMCGAVARNDQPGQTVCITAPWGILGPDEARLYSERSEGGDR